MISTTRSASVSCARSSATARRLLLVAGGRRRRGQLGDGGGRLVDGPRAARRRGGAATGSGASTYVGSSSSNELPSPGVLRTRISPPSMRVISRLIDRPRPVPPKRRLVVPSACWKASKISRSLSSAMPIPRIAHGDRDRVGGAILARAPRSPASSSATSPCSVNLNALESRLRSTCSTRCSSVKTTAGVSGAVVTSSFRPFCSATEPERALDVLADPADLDRAGVDLHLAGLDLRQVEDVGDQRQQVGAGGVDR